MLFIFQVILELNIIINLLMVFAKNLFELLYFIYDIYLIQLKM